MMERFLSAAADPTTADNTIISSDSSCDCHQHHAHHSSSLTASALAALSAASHSDEDTDTSSVDTDATSLLEEEEEEDIEEQGSDHTSVTLIEDDSYDFDCFGDDDDGNDKDDDATVVDGRVHFCGKLTQYHDDPHTRDAATDWYSRSQLTSFREQRRVQVHRFNNLQKRNCQGMGTFGSSLKDLFQACCEVIIHEHGDEEEYSHTEVNFWQHASPLRRRQVQSLFPQNSSIQQPQRNPRSMIDPFELVGLERQLVPLARHTLNQRQDYLQKVVWQIQQQHRHQHRLRLKSLKAHLAVEEEIRLASQSASIVCVAWAQVIAQAQWDFAQRLLQEECERDESERQPDAKDEGTLSHQSSECPASSSASEATQNFDD